MTNSYPTATGDWAECVQCTAGGVGPVLPPDGPILRLDITGYKDITAGTEYEMPGIMERRPGIAARQYSRYGALAQLEQIKFSAELILRMYIHIYIWILFNIYIFIYVYYIGVYLQNNSRQNRQRMSSARQNCAKTGYYYWLKVPHAPFTTRQK